jgi:hypothetical protein
MGQYTPAFSSSSTVTPTAIATEFSAIATAHNSHATGDFGVATVPNTGLATNKNYFTLTLKLATQTGALSAQLGDTITMPVAATLTAVRCSVGTFAVGAGSNTLDIYLEDGTPATIGAPVTIAAAVTSYTFTPTTTSFSLGDILSLRVTTTAGATMSQINMTLLFKIALTS